MLYLLGVDLQDPRCISAQAIISFLVIGLLLLRFFALFLALFQITCYFNNDF